LRKREQRKTRSQIQNRKELEYNIEHKDNLEIYDFLIRCLTSTFCIGIFILH
jgi:hypothetical protein